MTDEKIKLECLKLALQTPYQQDFVQMEKTYYAFIKEIGGDNIVNAANRFKGK